MLVEVSCIESNKLFKMVYVMYGKVELWSFLYYGRLWKNGYEL
jgi:hypothetical protein